MTTRPPNRSSRSPSGDNGRGRFADLDPERIRRRIARLGLGEPLHFFETIDSTNTFLRGLPPGRLRHGMLALADHQTEGRGRFERRWSDRPGCSLLFSLVLAAPRPAGRWPVLTLGAAGVVCELLRDEGIAEAAIRWPNDVIVGGRKVCGILTEKAPVEAALVLGVGLNVHQEQGDFPPEIRTSAASLRMVAEGRAWRREDLLVGFLARFRSLYDRWCMGRDAEVVEDCRRLMATLGRLVYLYADGRRIEGIVMGLDSDGGLILREPTGVVSRWHSGDVEQLRWGE